MSASALVKHISRPDMTPSAKQISKRVKHRLDRRSERDEIEQALEDEHWIKLERAGIRAPHIPGF